jgi:Ca2+-binding RTX toxin-like protein
MRRGMFNVGTQYGRLAAAAILALAAGPSLGCAMQSGGRADDSPTASQLQFISVPLMTAPAFVAHTGAVTVSVQDETAEIYINAADSSLMVNGVQAVDGTTTPPTVAIAAGAKANIKSIAITDTMGTAGDVVILNYVNGFYGQGTHTTAATTVNLVAHLANSLVIKGPPAGNYIAFGATGITLNNALATPTKDITATNISAYDVYLGAGNDKFTAGGNTAVPGVFPNPVSIYGGPGNDTLVEGTVPTPAETFSGGPGVDTVDYSARTAPVSAAIDPLGVITSGDTPTMAGDPTQGATEGDIILDADVIKGGTAADQLMGGIAGTVTLNGGAGDDLFAEGDDTYKGGTDIIQGGGGTDTVDYSLRTRSLTIVMDGVTASGDPHGGTGTGEKDIIGTDVANVKWGGTAGTSISSVTGNALNNVFTPGPGTSTISGLAGDDTLIEGADANNTGNDTFHGGTGNDTVDYTARTHALSVTMDDTTHSGDTAHGEADVIDVDVENLYGGTGDDTLVGNALDNDIEGGDGDDILAGGAGNDTLVGATTAAASNMENNQLHGNNVMDTPEPGAFNMCINVGGGGTGTPTTVGTQNCELIQN